MSMIPKINYKTFDITLPSNNKNIKARHYLVKEEKILLMAQESNDENEIVDAIKQVIRNCIIDNVDLDKLPIFDILWIFLQLRIKSVGETINLKLKHNKVQLLDGENYTHLNSKDEECNHEELVTVDLTKAYIKSVPEHTNKIKITDSIMVIMKYPTNDTLKNLKESSTAIELILDMISLHIDSIIDGEDVYQTKEMSRDDVLTFIESLPRECLEEINEKFFNSFPKICLDVEYKCSGCGEIEKYTVEGVLDFFI